MALWVDKYRPRELSKLSYHLDQADKLVALVSTVDFPHLLFCGPNGSGKRTRIHCLLKKMYGRGVENMHVEDYHFQTPSGKKLQINIVNSNYHIELTPSDVGVYDRVVVQNVIKEMAKVQQLNKQSQKAFKVVVLLEAENLTKEAQHSLRRTMEKYAATCKIILCCDSASRIIEPLKSRCMVIRVPAPSDDQIRACIQQICEKERITISECWLNHLLKKADGNLRTALTLLETNSCSHGNNLYQQPINEMEWKTYVKETARLIVQKQNEKCLLEVRQRFYELLCRCISISTIFLNLVDELVQICDPSLVAPMVAAAANYEHSSKLGSKDIYHLEAFVAAFMELAAAQRHRQQKMEH